MDSSVKGLTKNIKIIKRWFESVRSCGVVTPNGWFGRPYDNQHRLTDCRIERKVLIIELDNRLLLQFHGEVYVKNLDDELIFSDFTMCIFEWKEYVSNLSRREEYDSGSVKLIKMG